MQSVSESWRIEHRETVKSEVPCKLVSARGLYHQSLNSLKINHRRGCAANKTLTSFIPALVSKYVLVNWRL